jgi:molybdopterin molybdotransferase
MDGYAIKFSEKKQWKVIGELTAGKFHDILLSEDDAVLITTGSKIPNHSDNVIPNEDLELKNGFIQLKENAFFKKEMNIRVQGSDLAKGKTAIKNYTKITPQIVSVAASCGKDALSVFKQFKIAILCIGDELIPIKQIFQF